MRSTKQQSVTSLLAACHLQPWTNSLMEPGDACTISERTNEFVVQVSGSMNDAVITNEQQYQTIVLDATFADAVICQSLKSHRSSTISWQCDISGEMNHIAQILVGVADGQTHHTNHAPLLVWVPVYPASTPLTFHMRVTIDCVNGTQQSKTTDQHGTKHRSPNWTFNPIPMDDVYASCILPGNGPYPENRKVTLSHVTFD